jgi:hypothetical protein
MKIGELQVQIAGHGLCRLRRHAERVAFASEVIFADGQVGHVEVPSCRLLGPEPPFVMQGGSSDLHPSTGIRWSILYRM